MDRSNHVLSTRTEHDVDVVVKSVHTGFDVMWIVECKHWKTPVSKLHVLGLRQIVIDAVGDANRLRISHSQRALGIVRAL